MKIQWGSISSTSGSESTKTFSVTYTVAPMVICVPHISGGNTPGYGNFAYSITKDNFKIQAWQAAHWLAIGY